MTSGNNYDKYADKWQKKVLGDKHYAHNFLEKPAMYAKLPNLKGKKVLCLGCGSGEECFKMRDLGAAEIVGLDNSKGLIQKAKYTYPNITFDCVDIEKMNFEPESFDFVYSSLTMHYIEDWEPVIKKIYSYLKPGGKFLFSTHHPAKWGALTTRTKEYNKFVLGYKKNKVD
jgi:SAM-dependent methyltransferase